MKMTKNILIPLNDSVHEEWSQIKGETTWKEILELGIEAKERKTKIEKAALFDEKKEG